MWGYMFMKRGFTLLEILICLIVIGTLLAILFPAFLYVRNNSKRITTFSSLRNLGVAWQMYMSDYDDYVMRGSYGGSNWFGIGGDNGVLFSYVRMRDIRDKSVDDYKFNTVWYWPGYGYNSYLSVNDNFGKPSAIHYSSIVDPSSTVCFAPSAGLFRVNGVDSLYGVSLLSYPSSRFPTFHARFSGYSGVLWVDGHVSNVRAKYLLSNEKYRLLNLGEIDRDNDWRTNEYFDLD
jgi:prepilin-type N-terminal cleavage/methylation domain-containing protein/prepilin-type processing-associated H-X9-DG protein